MSWLDQLKGDSLSWLLEPNSPGVRYLALRDLVRLPPDDPELLSARKMAHKQGPIATVLDKMQPEGYWSRPGAGYSPKYWSGVWSILMLAQMGGFVNEDARIQQACDYYLEKAFSKNGVISYNGTPSGTFDCLQGNLCWALTEFGYDDPRLDAAYEWMARSVTGDGIAPATDKVQELRYHAYKCGPNFACGANNKQPCAWGAAKVMLAFSKWPVERRSALIERAIKAGVDFLFSTDPARADYPSGLNENPSQNWWKFGFPVFYISDILQIVEALAALGYGNDPRLANTIALIIEKQNAEGRWLLDYDYKGKSWVNFGSKKKPNKWVTLRALRVLKVLG